MDQVGGAKQQRHRAVSPLAEAVVTRPTSTLPRAQGLTRLIHSGLRVRRAKEINQPVRPSSLFRMKKKVSVWALVLSEHLYPGSPRNEGVAHSPVSTTDSHGA